MFVVGGGGERVTRRQKGGDQSCESWECLAALSTLSNNSRTMTERSKYFSKTFLIIDHDSPKAVLFVQSSRDTLSEVRDGVNGSLFLTDKQIKNTVGFS